MALLLAAVAWLAVSVLRRPRRRPVRDEGPGTPYRVFTREHDRELRARAVPAALADDSFLRANKWAVADPDEWASRVDQARGIVVDPTGELHVRLRTALRDRAGEWAIYFLVDQSGSMRDRIVEVAAAMRWASEALTGAGASVALRGFTTLGWRGGAPRLEWLADDRRPRRPGRLCALLHLTYQEFGETLRDEDWRVMVRPHTLFENVDGEALDWAAASLARRPEANKLLVVVSDGAPVDDSTLMYNGPSYLVRHLRSTVAAIDAAGQVTLAALGIGYGVHEHYARSAYAEAASDTAARLVDLIEPIVSQSTQALAPDRTSG